MSTLSLARCADSRAGVSVLCGLQFVIVDVGLRCRGSYLRAVWSTPLNIPPMPPGRVWVSVVPSAKVTTNSVPLTVTLTTGLPRLPTADLCGLPSASSVDAARLDNAVWHQNASPAPLFLQHRAIGRVLWFL